MKAALLAGAVDPRIGGVLIRGEKGTGKTTVVRGLSQLLPALEVMTGCPFHCDPRDQSTLHEECREKILAAEKTAGSAQSASPSERRALDTQIIPVPLVELPLNATEERLAGSIHLEETLRTGRRHFEPGLLASANRGILYIDEVNLLEDHLVDLILDAAATGVHRVEREGFSLVHNASFFLIGTMNPEEGELRPQFLDRFGLCTSIKGVRDPGERKEIARRRLDFDADPAAFIARYQKGQEDLRRKIGEARKLLPQVDLSEELWDMIVDLAGRAGVQGHRADIVTARTAKAFAALNGRSSVYREDIREAARLALVHRISGAADDTPESSEDHVDRLLGGASMSLLQKEVERGGTGDFEDSEIMQVPGSAAAGSIVFDFLKKKKPSLSDPSEEEVRSRIELSKKDLRILSKPFGRSKHLFSKKRGPRGKSISIRPLRPGEKPTDIAWAPTIVNTLLKRGEKERIEKGSAKAVGKNHGPEHSSLIRPEELRIHVRRRQVRVFVLFVIDASDSMGARQRLSVAKAAVMALLQRAYQHRHEVAVVSFGGDHADLLLRPTSSVTLARRAMLTLEPDGATPLAAGISLALRVLHMAASRGAYDTKIVILLSDGEANVSLHRKADPRKELAGLMPRLRKLADSSIFVDTKRPVPGRISEMENLAEAAGGRYYRPEELTAGTVIRAVSRVEK
jgi:magnesium chelatase subunit D